MSSVENDCLSKPYSEYAYIDADTATLLLKSMAAEYHGDKPLADKDQTRRDVKLDTKPISDQQDISYDLNWVPGEVTLPDAMIVAGHCASADEPLHGELRAQFRDTLELPDTTLDLMENLKLRTDGGSDERDFRYTIHMSQLAPPVLGVDREILKDMIDALGLRKKAPILYLHDQAIMISAVVLHYMQEIGLIRATGDDTEVRNIVEVNTYAGKLARLGLPLFRYTDETAHNSVTTRVKAIRSIINEINDEHIPNAYEDTIFSAWPWLNATINVPFSNTQRFISPPITYRDLDLIVKKISRGNTNPEIPENAQLLGDIPKDHESVLVNMEGKNIVFVWSTSSGLCINHKK